MFTWPHKDTDWAPLLNDVEPVYVALCGHIAKRQQLVIVAHDNALKTHISELLTAQGIDLARVHFVVTPCNDTWARDHGPLTVSDGHQLKALDFTFNGWGNKFRSDLDNAINGALFDTLLNPAADRESVELVLEGGGIEINEHGVLLTTAECLLNENRNPALSKQEIEAELTARLGCTQFLWVEHGFLAGDDTDSHIDTLVRFAPNNTLVYVGCDDQSDEHYGELSKMAEQLKTFVTPDGNGYRLIELPWPDAKCDADGDRLPATYANYLIINGAVLVPTYRDEKDELALAQIRSAYPEHEVIGVDCLPIIHQFGSLHCISMQLPKGFLR